MNEVVKAKAEIGINGEPAGNELEKLETKAKSLRKQLKEIRKQDVIDEKKVKSINAALKKTNQDVKALKNSTTDYGKILDNLSGASIRDLNRLQGKLNYETKNLARNTDAYTKKSAQLKLVKAELTKIRKETMAVNSATGNWFGRMSDGFNRYMGFAAAASAAMIGTVLSLRKTVDAANASEESIDALSAITGLAGKELQWLGDTAKEMSVGMVEGNVRITKSSTDITKAFAIMGSKRPELLAVKEDLQGVTQDAIILSQAAKGELLPSVNALAISLNQFDAQADQSRRFINAIAAGSKAGAGDIPYLSTAIEKAGTVANGANLSLEQTIGVVETLAPKITDAAKAGNHIEKILIKLQQGADKFNPKVVGMTKALHNLADADMTVTEMKKMFSAEHLTAAKILIDGVSDYEKYTEAVTGTNTAIEQATINTDNNAAKLEQARNRVELMSITLGEKLAPALTFSTNAFSYMLKALVHIIKNWDLYKRIIIVSTVAIGGYTLATKASAIATWLQTTATKAATWAQKAFNTAVKGNPLGLMLTVLATAIAAMWAYSSSTRDAARAQGDLNRELTESEKLMAETKAIKDRMAVLEKLNERQLQTLQSNIQTEIEEIEDKEAVVNEKLSKSYNEKLQLLEEEMKTASFMRKTQLLVEKKALDEEFKGKILKETGLTSTQIAENKKRLDDWKKTVDARIRYLNDKAGKGKGKIETPFSKSELELFDEEDTGDDWDEYKAPAENEKDTFSFNDWYFKQLDARLAYFKKTREEEKQEERKTTEELKQEYMARAAATADMFGAMSEVSNMWAERQKNRYGEDSMEYKRALKRNVMFKLAADQASAISSLIAAAEGNPLNLLSGGLVGIAQFSTGMIRIGANFAQAFSSLEQINGYAIGGQTDVSNGGTVRNKQLAWFGEQGPEYVIPNEGYRNPSVSRIIGLLEAARVNGSLSTVNFDRILTTQGFAVGGSTGAAPMPNLNTAMLESLLIQLIAKTDAVSKRPINVPYSDIDKKRKKLDNVYSRITPK